MFLMSVFLQLDSLPHNNLLPLRQVDSEALVYVSQLLP